MLPVALPVAFDILRWRASAVVVVARGGIFGDHVSTDTDRVVTQLPQALLVALLTIALYLFL